MHTDQESRDRSSYFLRPEHPEDNETLAHLNANLPDAAAFFENSMVRVVRTESPYRFYVWPLNHTKSNWELLYEINDYYSNQSNRINVQRECKNFATTYIVNYGGLYFRARVLFNIAKMVAVYLFDFGRYLIIDESSIFICEPRFASMQDMAYLCSLTEDQLPTDISCDETTFQNVVLGNVFEAQLLYVDTFQWTQTVVRLWRVLEEGYDLIKNANQQRVEESRRVPICDLLWTAINLLPQQDQDRLLTSMIRNRRHRHRYPTDNDD
ncbi:hypothetical protein ACOME3_006446 [Neoechinorhynchus agilis]